MSAAITQSSTTLYTACSDGLSDILTLDLLVTKLRALAVSCASSTLAFDVQNQTPDRSREVAQAAMRDPRLLGRPRIVAAGRTNQSVPDLYVLS